MSQLEITGFAGGRSIAMKLPPHQFDDTLRYYRDILGLRVLESQEDTMIVEYGVNRLWLG